MRFALIELHVNLSGITAPSQTDAVIAGIRRDPRREAAVRAAVEHARLLGCGFILLPGWTLVADRPPDWLLSLSSGGTVVAECLRPLRAPSQPRGRVKGGAAPASSATTAKGAAAGDGDHEDAGPIWEGFVLRDGRAVVGPARQRVAGAAELWHGDVLSGAGVGLVGDLQARGPSGRRWQEPGVGEAMLLLCGEANVVGGGGPAECWNYESVEGAGLTEQAWRAVKLIVNPAHTRSGPQALRDKRAWLSRGGLLVHTANTHSGGWRLGEGDDAVAGRASHTAACAWAGGEQVGLEGTAAGDDYSIMTLEWTPTPA